MGELTATTEDYIAIRRLQDSYADVVSRRAFAELHHLFLPEATVMIELPGGTREVTGPEAFGRYVEKRVADLEFFQFVILNSVVDLLVDGDSDRARARTHMCELRQGGGDGRFSVLYGLYRDEYAGRRPLVVRAPPLRTFGHHRS